MGSDSHGYLCNTQQVFTNEITNIRSNLRRLPLVQQLRLFLDKRGAICCGRRIHNAPATELAKFPYLLPAKHPFKTLVVHAIHKVQLHAGVNATLTAIRQQYWIPSARRMVRKLLGQCVICQKVVGKPYQAPDPLPLLKARTQEMLSFEVTGVDFTGTSYVQDSGREVKVYVCLFTCAVTRAVPLEIVIDLSTETFLQAFRKKSFQEL